MQQINWDQFGLKAESKQKSFEDLCLFLCCRELGVAKIDAYHNQPGIETEPFEVNGEKYGFQAKFFETKFDWSQLKRSVAKAIDKYPNLAKIIIYSNKERTTNLKVNDKTKAETDLEAKAKKKKVELEYITAKDIQLKLSSPANFDLAQLFFGVSDEFNFIKNSTNPEILTFLQSSGYLELPFADEKANRVDDLATAILASTDKEFLINGHPGSGKSVFLHNLLRIFGGLDKADKNGMQAVLLANKAVPTLVNLKNCATDSLENILRSRKNDCRVNSQQLGFIYLFDGLDELNEERADSVLSQIYELRCKDTTKKIVITCRSGNLNRIKAKMYFDAITEFAIENLEPAFVDRYFEAKNDDFKCQKLQKLKEVNTNIVEDVKDVFLIKLLWDTIENLDETSTVIDLFGKKIDLLLESPRHRKNLAELNLPNPKKQQIIELNQDIAFEFQKEFQFRFSQQDLQRLILNKFDRLDYESANRILNYLSDSFFENSYPKDEQTPATFIYQHRRYQEFFFAQKLKTEYERNPRILRELKVLSNREFFENLFLKYIRKEYEKENDLAGLIELNLIDVYLGKHKSFGADEPYYLNSDEFMPALASQNEAVFSELLADENLELKRKLAYDFQAIELYHKNNKTQLIKDSLNLFIVNFFKRWKNEEDDEDDWKDQEVEHQNRLFHDQFESFLFYLLVYKSVPAKELLQDVVRSNYDRYLLNDDFGFEEQGRKKFIKSFVRLCLREKKDDLFDLLADFSDYEFIALLDVLKTIEYLPVFVQSPVLQNKVKSFVESFSAQPDRSNYHLLFFKKFFGAPLSEDEIIFAKKELSRLRDERKMSWHYYQTQLDYALISFALDINSFATFSKQKDGYTSYYFDELGLYAALYQNYADLLAGPKKIAAIVRDYSNFVASRRTSARDSAYLITETSRLWARIFVHSNDNGEAKSVLKIRLIKQENRIHPLSFYSELNKISPELFGEMVNENDLQADEDYLLKWEDTYQAYVDRCFELARLYSALNPEKAKLFTIKGLNDGAIRHGWRKDTIVSYNLVDALEILWRNNWESGEKLKEYTEQVFALTLRLNKITDGKETWRGPYNAIEMISDYDVELADNLKNKLIESEVSHNFPNIAHASVLLGKVKIGVALNLIEREMSDFRFDYDHEGKPEVVYYERKIEIYLSIAESDLYTEDEKKQAFERLCAECEEMQSQKLSYFLREGDFENVKSRLVKLSSQYGKQLKVIFKEKDQKDKKVKVSENEFVEKVRKANSIKNLDRLFHDLSDHNNEIVLSKPESWSVLVNKTFEVNGNIKQFTGYLSESHYPHFGFWTTNSDYLHFALAATLKNINTRRETFEYLSKNSGYGGFVNVMKAYEVNKDKKTCLALFERYFRFCDFLIN